MTRLSGSVAAGLKILLNNDAVRRLGVGILLVRRRGGRRLQSHDVRNSGACLIQSLTRQIRIRILLVAIVIDRLQLGFSPAQLQVFV